MREPKRNCCLQQRYNEDFSASMRRRTPPATRVGPNLKDCVAAYNPESETHHTTTFKACIRAFPDHVVF